MNKSRLVCALIALCTCVTVSSQHAFAAAEPADRFLDAYFLIQEADSAERNADWAKARAKFAAALDILHDIQTASPSWNPHIVEFRVNYCNGRLKELESKLALAPSPAAPPVAAADTERVRQLTAELQQAQENIHHLEAARDELTAKLAAAPVESAAPESAAELQRAQAQIRQLQNARDGLQTKLDDATKQAAKTEALVTELQQSRDQIREMEATRADLNAKLQAALSKIAPTETSPQVEELLRQNMELAAQLAAAQSQLGKLSETTPASTTSAGEPTEVIRLRAELADARAEIQRTKDELAQTREQLIAAHKEVETAKAETTQVRRNYDDLVAQLTEANRKLGAAHASAEKGDQIIAELRKENALLHLIADRKTLSTRQPEQTGGHTIPELKGWFPNRRQPPKPQPKPEQLTEAPAITTEKSGRSKLVATLKAPPAKPKTDKPAPSETKSSAKPAAPATEESPAVSPEVRAWLSEARDAFSARDFDTAADRYDMVLAHDPKNLTALSNLGIVRYQQGRLDEAEESLRKAAALAPNDSGSRALLGVIYFRKGRLDEAFSELTRAVALDPRNAEAHNYLGITLSEKGWAAAAEQEILRAIELNPQYGDAHFNMAVLYAKQRNPRMELARYHYQKARDLGAAPDPSLEALLKATDTKPAPQTKP